MKELLLGVLAFTSITGAVFASLCLVALLLSCTRNNPKFISELSDAFNYAIVSSGSSSLLLLLIKWSQI